MTRTLLRGGRVFDGTGAPPAEADLLVEDGRILEVGPGLDGDEAVDVGGRHLLPGLFDCHTHVTLSNVNLLGLLQAPFSYRSSRPSRTWRPPCGSGSPPCGTRPGPTPGSSRPWPTGWSPGRGCRSR
jgi:formylmethanofuran dehydrogenase subunit A